MPSIFVGSLLSLKTDPDFERPPDASILSLIIMLDWTVSLKVKGTRRIDPLPPLIR